MAKRAGSVCNKKLTQKLKARLRDLPKVLRSIIVRLKIIRKIVRRGDLVTIGSEVFNNMSVENVCNALAMAWGKWLVFVRHAVVEPDGSHRLISLSILHR